MYKRQDTDTLLQGVAKQPVKPLGEVDVQVQVGDAVFTAVSYTHLAVYKRQRLAPVFPFSFAHGISTYGADQGCLVV